MGSGDDDDAPDAESSLLFTKHSPSKKIHGMRFECDLECLDDDVLLLIDLSERDGGARGLLCLLLTLLISVFIMADSPLVLPLLLFDIIEADGPLTTPAISLMLFK